MVTQQEKDQLSGYHNDAGYDSTGNRIDAGQTGYSTGNPAINSTILQPQAPINYSTPAPAQIPDVSGLVVPLSQPEQKASDLSAEIQRLNTEALGKSAFEDQQNQALGVTEAQNAITDLTQELTHTTKQATANSLQIQEQNRLMFSGKGIASSIVDRKGQSALRQNAIDSAIESFRISSLIDAANGNLSSAQSKVAEAIKRKYGPLEEKIDIATKNLNLVLNSPEFSAAEKERATKQLAIQEQKKADLADQKAEAANVAKVAISAANNSRDFKASADYPSLAVALRGISNAKTQADALAIAAEVGITDKPVNDKFQVVKGGQDAFGNVLPDQVFNSATGQFVGANSSGPIPQTGTPQAATHPVSENANGGLDFNQYGLLSNTDFDPKNLVDQLAQKYLDQYIKNGSVPTASTLGRNMKPEAIAKVDSRARELFYKATGSALPTPQVISGYLKVINGNNKILNNLNVQENTISKNFQLAVDNIDKGGINQHSQPVNAFLNMVKNLLGDPDTAQYLSQNATIQNEMASLLALRNASGTTVADKLASSGLVPENASEDQLKAILKVILQEAENGGSSIRAASADLYQQTDPFLQDVNNPLRANAIVNHALSKLGLDYNSVIQDMTTQYPNKIPVIETATGKIFAVDLADLRTGKYTRL